MQDSLPKHTIVLLGAGHTNAHIIKMWRMQPIRDVQLICVSNFGIATYSGMLPGTLAGQYTPSEMQIDLVRLCAASQVRLIQAQVTGLDHENRQLLLAGRPPLNYDVLSIGIGSVPTSLPSTNGIEVPIKPMQTFLSRLDERLQELAEKISDRPWKITIAGAGAAGIEIALCLQNRLSKMSADATFEISLVDRSDKILKNMPARTRNLAQRVLEERGIQLRLGREIVEISNSEGPRLDDGSNLPSDLVLWATSATSPPLLRQLGLPTDPRGFLLIRETLQSTAADDVFVVGDSSSGETQPWPKAGVYAVRQGPVLWENLRRRFAHQPLIKWKPQDSFLSLLNTGDGRALLTYKSFSILARWCWKLKDSIDRPFMAMYQNYEPAMPISDTSLPVDKPMYCGGCGCKVDADLLSRVLRQLDNPTTPQVLVGLDQPDDVAVLQPATGTAIAATADFFTSFLDDPHLMGRIAALNALSDMHAKGAKSIGALALVSVPHGPRHQQEQYLRELLDGSLLELRGAGVPLVGGHTIEGAQATIGFTILGEVDPASMASKGRLQEGDHLVLTKPLGSGILLAGHSRALCQSPWMETLLDVMLTSNQAAGHIARQMQLGAVTDVTGFGFAGHLVEMLRASNLSAELSLGAIPLLPGALELASQGVESTLAPGNRAAASYLQGEASLDTDPRYAILFDPQTSGGLLMAVSEDRLSELLDRLGVGAIAIGRVVKNAATRSLVQLLD